jgi:hypothetical protein
MNLRQNLKGHLPFGQNFGEHPENYDEFVKTAMRLLHGSIAACGIVQMQQSSHLDLNGAARTPNLNL